MVRIGLRTIEIIKANTEDIAYRTGETVLYIQGKGRDTKDNFILLTKKAYKPITDKGALLKLRSYFLRA